MKDTKKYFKLTFTSILIALMFALSWTVLGMVPMGIASATTVFIPVAIGIVCLDDYRYTSVLGVSFGLVSLIRALAPQGILDQFFVNPLVSVVPRFLAAICAHFIYRQIKKVVKVKFVNAGIGGALMALFNTLFTMSILVLVNYNKIFSLVIEQNTTIAGFLGTVALFNMLPEIAIGFILTAAVSNGYDVIVAKE